MAALQTSFEISSTTSVKADWTKLLLKSLTPLSSIVKAVVVYLTLKLKEQFAKFLPKIMPCTCCWKSQSFLEIATTFKFLEWRRFSQWKLNWLGWDFEMEPWKDGCC